VYPGSEFVFQAGEIASEMYFIISGTVEVWDPSNKIALTRLSSG